MDIEQYAEHFHFYSDDLSDWISELFAKYNPSSVLDLGCGDGPLIYALSKRGMLQGRSVYAVDLSSSRIEHVRKLNPGVQCQVASATSIPGIPDRSIALIHSSQVIEHVDDEKRMLQEIKRVLQPGGVVYLSTVFKKPWAWYFYRCNGRWVIDPTHLREYTDDEQLVRLIHDAGLKVVQSRKVLLWFPLMDFFFRALRLSVRSIYENPVFLLLRKMTQIPILGYYNWELVLEAEDAAGARKSSG